jgi:hypothetical protein
LPDGGGLEHRAENACPRAGRDGNRLSANNDATKNIESKQIDPNSGCLLSCRLALPARGFFW